MSKFTVGTLVMLNYQGSEPFIPAAPHNGAIGEIFDHTPWADQIAVGEVAVQFPRHPSPNGNGWKVPVTWLIPLGGPDIDIGDEDENPYVVERPVAETI